MTETIKEGQGSESTLEEYSGLIVLGRKVRQRLRRLQTGSEKLKFCENQICVFQGKLLEKHPLKRKELMEENLLYDPARTASVGLSLAGPCSV